MSKQLKNWLWVIAIILLVGILLRFLLPLIFNWEVPFYPHMFSPMMFPIGMFGMILFWGVVIYIAYILLNRGSITKTSNDLDVLKQRLSKGEISIEEYEKIKRTLEEDK